MAELDKSKQADVSIFMFLRINGQSIRPFVSEGKKSGMGAQKMSDLTYYNSAGSQDMLKAVAAQIAHMLIVYINTYYTQQREAGYENKTVQELIGVFIAVLVDPAKTVLDLAATADKVFQYANEGSAVIRTLRPTILVLQLAVGGERTSGSLSDNCSSGCSLNRASPSQRYRSESLPSEIYTKLYAPNHVVLGEVPSDVGGATQTAVCKYCPCSGACYVQQLFTSLINKRC